MDSLNKKMHNVTLSDALTTTNTTDCPVFFRDYVTTVSQQFKNIPKPSKETAYVLPPVKNNTLNPPDDDTLGIVKIEPMNNEVHALWVPANDHEIYRGYYIHLTGRSENPASSFWITYLSKNGVMVSGNRKWNFQLYAGATLHEVHVLIMDANLVRQAVAVIKDAVPGTEGKFYTVSHFTDTGLWPTGTLSISDAKSISDDVAAPVVAETIRTDCDDHLGEIQRLTDIIQRQEADNVSLHSALQTDNLEIDRLAKLSQMYMLRNEELTIKLAQVREVSHASNMENMNLVKEMTAVKQANPLPDYSRDTACASQRMELGPNVHPLDNKDAQDEIQRLSIKLAGLKCKPSLSAAKRHVKQARLINKINETFKRIPVPVVDDEILEERLMPYVNKAISLYGGRPNH